MIAPLDGGPAPAVTGDVATASGGNGQVGLRARVERRGEAAFRAFVRRSDDRLVERTAGSDAGLRLLFGAMAQRFEPAQAGGFTGDIQYVLTVTTGAERPWVVSVSRDRAMAHPGRATDPRLSLKLAAADFVRLAAGDLDAGKALIAGRISIRGDMEIAGRLGHMFGQPVSAY